MNIKKLALRNFKCFKKTDLDFSKITLLTGANSSGKSSVIHALLSVFQSESFPLYLSPNGDYKSDKFLKLVDRLEKYDPKRKADNAYLVVSNKLLHEYNRTNRDAKPNTTAITLIVIKLIGEGGLVKFKNDEIKDFQLKHFKGKTLRRLRSNQEDRDLIPVVLLSDRKYTLRRDQKFIYDLKHFPGFDVSVASKPQDLPYDR